MRTRIRRATQNAVLTFVNTRTGAFICLLAVVLLLNTALLAFDSLVGSRLHHTTSSHLPTAILQRIEDAVDSVTSFVGTDEAATDLSSEKARALSNSKDYHDSKRAHRHGSLSLERRHRTSELERDASGSDEAIIDRRVAGALRDNLQNSMMYDELCEEPIDAVYTWVNGSDPQHQSDVAYWQWLAAPEENIFPDSIPTAAPVATTLAPSTTRRAPTNHSSRRSRRPQSGLSAISDEQENDQSSRSRFEDHDELKFSLRSLERYAGWVRHVYLVTNGQVPTWINLNHPKLTVVPHHVIFPNVSHLPTFSSPAIECHLHRIPGLSKKFLYLNDDTFFGAPVQLSDFESKIKGHRLFYSWPVPACSDGCPAAWLGDGTCDRQCNTSACDYDNGDCVGPNVRMMGGMTPPSPPAGSVTAPPRAVPATAGGVRNNCHMNCADAWIGDKHCDTHCNHPACGYDATDCGMAPYENDKTYLKLNLPWADFTETVNALGRASLGSSTTAADHGPTTTTTRVPSASSSPSATLPSASLPVIARRARFQIPFHTKSFLLNLSAAFPIGMTSARILSGEYGSPSWVRTATLSQIPRILIVTVMPPPTETSVGKPSDRLLHPHTATFHIVGERSTSTVSSAGGFVKVQVRLDINVTRDAAPLTFAPTTATTATTTTTTTTTNAPEATEAVTTSDEEANRSSSSHATHRNVIVVTTTEPPVDVTTPLAVDRNNDQKKEVVNVEDVISSSSPMTTVNPNSIVVPTEEEAATTQRKLLARREEQTLSDAAWAASLSQLGAGPLEQDRDETGGNNAHVLLVNEQQQSTQRRLLDLFGDSLKFSNRLLNRQFRGIKPAIRKVPAHMVHLIRKDVMEQLWDRWPSEWDATSASRFRSRSNLQYAFMHYYYLVHATRDRSDQELFDELLDHNRNGVLEGGEERRVGLLLWKKRVSFPSLQELVQEMLLEMKETLFSSSWPESPYDREDTSSGRRSGRRACFKRAWELAETSRMRTLFEPKPPPPPPSYDHHSPQPRNASRHSNRTATTAAAAGRPVEAPPTAPGNPSASSSSELFNKPSPDSGPRFSMMRNSATQQHASRVQHHRSSNQADQYRVMPPVMMEIVHWLLMLARVGVKFEMPPPPSPPAPTTTTAVPSSSIGATPPPAPSPPPRERTMWCGGEGDATQDDSERSQSSQSSNPSAPAPPPLLTAELFQSSHIAELLAVHYKNIEKYQTVNEDLDDVTFIMVRNNITIVQHEMDHVRYKQPKFLCINDDMDHEHENYPVVLELMQELLRSYFPTPSTFELPEGQRNGFVRLPSGYERRRFPIKRSAVSSSVDEGSAASESVFMTEGHHKSSSSSSSIGSNSSDATAASRPLSSTKSQDMREMLQSWMEDLLDFVVPETTDPHRSGGGSSQRLLFSETVSLLLVLVIVLGLLWWILDRYCRVLVERHVLGQEVRRRHFDSNA